jgi:hypothetical protein
MGSPTTPRTRMTRTRGRGITHLGRYSADLIQIPISPAAIAALGAPELACPGEAAASSTARVGGPARSSHALKTGLRLGVELAVEPPPDIAVERTLAVLVNSSSLSI